MDWFDLFGVLLGSGITILTVFYTHRFQLKRDMESRKFEKANREFELIQEYRLELIRSLEEINYIIGKIEHSISLTSSVIEASHDLSQKEFDKKYQEECDLITKLESIAISRFPDTFWSIRKLSGLHNQYWGFQRMLLNLALSKETKEERSTLHKEIIRINGSAQEEFSAIRNQSLLISENIKNGLIK